MKGFKKIDELTLTECLSLLNAVDEQETADAIRGRLRFLDDAAFSRCSTKAEYQAYIQDFHDGAHLDEASEKIAALEQAEEDAAFRKCKKESDYRSYLKNYPDGRFSSTAQTYLDKKRTKGETSLRIVSLFVIVLVFGLALYFQGRELNSCRNSNNSLRTEISDWKQRCENSEKERDDVQKEYSDLKEKVSGVYPMIITDIEIAANKGENASIFTDYGQPIYSSSTMYLYPRIKYAGFTSGDKILSVKWYEPDGTLKRGIGSPVGFTQSRTYHVSGGDNNTLNLWGWGSETKGAVWKSGTYRIEIWYGNSCLKAKTFKIY